MIQRLAALIFLTAGLTSPLLAGPESWYEAFGSVARCPLNSHLLG